VTLVRCMLATLLCGAAWLHSPRIEAQSFDCEKASTVVEKAICSDQSVKVMDVELAQDYRQAMARYPTRRSDFVSSQRQWLAFREAHCSRYEHDSGKMDDCLRDIYRQRIAEVTSRNISELRSQEGSSRAVLCDFILNRYRSLAQVHPGASPISLVSSTPHSGLTRLGDAKGTGHALRRWIHGWNRQARQGPQCPKT
jgi:uncharacterized protein YecT (DUF1311 family)